MSAVAESKQINKLLSGFREISGFTANGINDVVTAEITANLGTLPVQVYVPDVTEGVITTGNNRVEIWNSTTQEKVTDASGMYEVYARLTEAGGVYTLTYFYLDNTGTEQSHDFTVGTDIDFIYAYQYTFQHLPNDFAIVLPESKVNQDIKNANGLHTVEALTVTATNTVNDLVSVPFNVNNVIITVNGLALYAGIHFTIVGQTITFLPINIGYDIETTDTLYAIYFRV